MTVINIDVSNPQSISEAAAFVRRYSNKITSRLKTALKIICQKGAEIAAKEYGAAVEVSYTFVGDDLCIVSANGDDVCFLEFGTGFVTDSEHPYAGKVPFGVYPGSWSMTEGAGTFDAWVNSGKDPASYPYNTTPRRAMLHAYEKIYDIAEKTIKEVFSK